MRTLEININNTKPTQFNFGDTNIQIDEKNTIETQTVFDESSIKGWYKESNFEEFRIGHGNYSTTKNSRIVCNYSERVIEMIFVLEGYSKVYFNKNNTPHLFTSNTHTIFHCKNDSTEIEFKDTKSHFLIIQLNTKFFKNLIPSEANFNDFKELINENKTGCISKENNAIHSAMKIVIEDIINSPWEGEYRKLFLHSKILDLLLLQLDQYKFLKTKKESDISVTDTMKIKKAKEYLLKHYKEPITIQKLSKIVGTNEFTLKKGFKTLYGETIFCCVNNLKMTKAKKLLTDKNLSVTQVSEIIGYKNPQHFSTAFKKKFGFVPSKLKH